MKLMGPFCKNSLQIYQYEIKVVVFHASRKYILEM
jgi:hypothetical protein